MTKEQKQEFINLALNLEPERLYCDGERSKSEAMKVYKQIMKRWKALEKEVGETVDTYEPFNWI